MLFEKKSYRDDFPINIEIGNVREYPIHYHQDTEFVMVLKGSIALKSGYCTYHLKEGDIFTNNGHEVHRLYSDGTDNVIAVIQISNKYFSQYFPELYRACYRTYSNHGSTKKNDLLRQKLLQLLLKYLVRSYHYKTECTYLMVDVIKYLDKYFNLFAFSEDMVINFESSNQITIDRISRIINYIYEYHSEKITLDDLAEMEHLSTFYLSHIIKSCTGMNFRDFLCFARVEWSEIDLLETSKKISRIAKDVGFSTTSYYEKYFKKWFGETPSEYRERCLPLVLSDTREPVLIPVPTNEIVTLIRRYLTGLDAKENSKTRVSSLKLELKVSSDQPAVSEFNYRLHAVVTPDDLEVLGHRLYTALEELSPEKVEILAESKDCEKISALKEGLESMGIPFEMTDFQNPRNFSSFAFDSIAYPIFCMNRLTVLKDSIIRFRLRDPDVLPESVETVSHGKIKGYPAVMTSDGIKKPVFYLFFALSRINGDLIIRGKQYCVLRIPSGRDSLPGYVIFAYNFNDSIYQMCSQETTAHHTKYVLNEFKDEVDISVDLSVDRSVYSILKYSLPRGRSVFGYLAGLDFPDSDLLRGFDLSVVTTAPELEAYREDAQATFNVNFSLKGADFQLAVISPC